VRSKIGFGQSKYALYFSTEGVPTFIVLPQVQLRTKKVLSEKKDEENKQIKMLSSPLSQWQWPVVVCSKMH
jgi:hypothetical protein